MESSNIHHHQHQLQLQLQLQLHQDQIAGTSSLATTPSCYGVGSISSTNWIPSSILNTHGFRSYPSETVLSPRQQENTLLSSQYSSIAAPDLGFHWGNTSTTGSFFNNQSKQDLQLSRIKEEQSNGNVMNKMEVFPGNLYSSNGSPSPNNGRGFSQIFPSVHVSNLNPYSSDMNLHALDLPTSSRVCGNFSPCSENRVEVSRDGFCYGGLDHMPHQTHHMSLYRSNKISASCNGFVETKRTSSNMEPKAIQTVPKKSRLQARVSCPPFKVRKEKLGDRIAALQQLVAPFGKTDTASVLMEAIGYIKFLQNQVETLSVPYMKTSRNKTSPTIKRGSTETDSEESKRGLKSRGLCLVPLSCLSYITDGGGAVWPPPHFGGAT